MTMSLDGPPVLQDQAAAGAMWYRALLADVGQMIEERIKGMGGARTSTLWFGLSSGSTDALAITEYIDVPVDFPFLITGWRLLSRDNGAIVLSVRRATYAEYPSFTSITASAPPTLVTRKAFSDTVPGWTTQINGDDVLTIGVTSNAGAVTRVWLGLRVVKLGSGRAT